MMWTVEASSVAYKVQLNPVARKMAETVAAEAGVRAVTIDHLHDALKRIEQQNQYPSPVPPNVSGQSEMQKA